MILYPFFSVLFQFYFTMCDGLKDCSADWRVTTASDPAEHWKSTSQHLRTSQIIVLHSSWVCYVFGRRRWQALHNAQTGTIGARNTSTILRAHGRGIIKHQLGCFPQQTRRSQIFHRRWNWRQVHAGTYKATVLWDRPQTRKLLLRPLRFASSMDPRLHLKPSFSTIARQPTQKATIEAKLSLR